MMRSAATCRARHSGGNRYASSREVYCVATLGLYLATGPRRLSGRYSSIRPSSVRLCARRIAPSRSSATSLALGQTDFNERETTLPNTSLARPLPFLTGVSAQPDCGVRLSSDQQTCDEQDNNQIR